MRRFLISFALAFVAATPTYCEARSPMPSTAAAGPQSAAAEPSVDQILDKYVQALGGQEAMKKLSTRTMKGSLQDRGSGEIGTIEVLQKAPDKGFAVTSSLSNGRTPRGFNGKSGWSVDPDEGLQDASEDDVAAMKREFDFYRPLRLKTVFSKMEYKGKGTVVDHSCHVVEATDQKGAVAKMYFDTQSGLLVRDEVPYVTEDGTSVLQIDYDDYREVDGVKLPFVRHQSSPDYDYLIKFEEIRHNVPIDDSKFEKPAATQ